jgi:hypothetical protein
MNITSFLRQETQELLSWKPVWFWLDTPLPHCQIPMHVLYIDLLRFEPVHVHRARILHNGLCFGQMLFAKPGVLASLLPSAWARPSAADLLAHSKAWGLWELILPVLATLWAHPVLSTTASTFHSRCAAKGRNKNQRERASSCHVKAGQQCHYALFVGLLVGWRCSASPEWSGCFIADSTVHDS